MHTYYTYIHTHILYMHTIHAYILYTHTMHTYILYMHTYYTYTHTIHTIHTYILYMHTIHTYTLYTHTHYAYYTCIHTMRYTCVVYIYAMYVYNGTLLSYKKEWNNAICSYLNGLKDCHTEWSKSDRERQNSISLTCEILKKIVQMKLFTKQK